MIDYRTNEDIPSIEIEESELLIHGRVRGDGLDVELARWKCLTWNEACCGQGHQQRGDNQECFHGCEGLEWLLWEDQRRGGGQLYQIYTLENTVSDALARTSMPLWRMEALFICVLMNKLHWEHQAAAIMI
jgi:hypothetical protein